MVKIVFSVFFLVYKIIFFGDFPRVKNYAINCFFLRAPSCQKSCMLLQLLDLLQNAMILISSNAVHHVILQNSTAIFMMGYHD